MNPNYIGPPFGSNIVDKLTIACYNEYTVLCEDAYCFPTRFYRDCLYNCLIPGLGSIGFYVTLARQLATAEEGR